MPYRRGGSYRRGFGRRRGAMSLNVINSIKNVRLQQAGLTATQQVFSLARAVDSAVTSVDVDVEKGCKIMAMYLIVNAEGTGGTGVVNVMDMFIMKNPGANLTVPGAKTVGTSNEKKFVFKQWRELLPRVQDGAQSFHWEGWIKIPRLYQRMGTDDLLQLAVDVDVTANFCYEAIYKWYK